MNTQEEGKKEATDEGSEDGDDVEENEGRDDQWEDTHSDFDMEVSSNQTEEETRTTRKSSGSSKRPENYGTCGAGRVIIHIIRRVIQREAPPKSHP
nr:hypothetical protein BaRGS_007856 [Batillaria attramentaria]